MTDNKKPTNKEIKNEKAKNEELTDEQANEAVGGFAITPAQFGLVKCAAKGCDNWFKPKKGETLCEKCRQPVSVYKV